MILTNYSCRFWILASQNRIARTAIAYVRILIDALMDLVIPWKLTPRLNLSTARAFFVGLVSERMGMMFSVKRSAHDNQVLWRIVQLIVVNMVNDFERLKRSSENFLHYLTMLKDRLAFDPQISVSIRSNVAASWTSMHISGRCSIALHDLVMVIAKLMQPYYDRVRASINRTLDRAYSSRHMDILENSLLCVNAH